MKETEPYPIIKSTSHDVNWLLITGAVCTTIGKIEEELGPRVEAVDGKKCIVAAAERMKLLRNMLFLTYPPEKRPAINRQFGRLYMDVKTSIPIGSLAKNETVVDVDVLDTLIKYAHRMNC